MILWLAYFSKTSCGNHFKDDKLSSSPTTVKPEKNENEFIYWHEKRLDLNAND